MIDNQQSPGGTVLYGVPRVHYGAFGGVTPLPICVKACADYLGTPLSYEEAIVGSGAAFRLAWNAGGWDGGNVDVIFTYPDPARIYRQATACMGRACDLLGRQGADKEQFKAKIRASLDEGLPVIALGIIGPPEAGIVCGYRDGGDTLLGWSLFQDNPENGADARFDPSGYYITDAWWENPETHAVITLGGEVPSPLAPKVLLQNAIDALQGSQAGERMRGVTAYDGWKAALLRHADFEDGTILPLLAERMMCHGDAMDCLADGRGNAAKYFDALSKAEGPNAKAYATLAGRFGAVSANVNEMARMLGGWARGEEQMRKLAERPIREKTAALIDRCKAADESALGLMREIVAGM